MTMNGAAQRPCPFREFHGWRDNENRRVVPSDLTLSPLSLYFACPFNRKFVPRFRRSSGIPETPLVGPRAANCRNKRSRENSLVVLERMYSRLALIPAGTITELCTPGHKYRR